MGSLGSTGRSNSILVEFAAVDVAAAVAEAEAAAFAVARRVLLGIYYLLNER